MKKRTIIIVALAILLSISIFLLINNLNKGESDASKFAKEYTEVSEKNVFVYRDIEEIINIMKNGTGVVYLGFPECPWCQTYVKYLDEAAKSEGIEKIYYYNILEDRKNNTVEYKEIVGMLSSYLQKDEEGVPRIYVPNVSFHVDGKIVGNDYETSKDTHDLKDPKEYWTNEEVSELKTSLTTYMKEVKKALSVCTKCNKD